MSMKNTLGMQAVSRVGFRRGTKALSILAAWAIAEARAGHEITSIQEFGKFWRQSTATAYRDVHEFRLAFPRFDTPRDLLAVVEPSNPVLFAWSKKPGPKEHQVLALQLLTVMA